jgi:hypothetical protein
MNKYLFLYSFLFSFSLFAQEKYSIFELKSFQYKNKNIDSFIYFKNKAISEYESQGKQYSAARCLQSIGFVYEEELHDYYKSFYYISLSIDKYKDLKDTLGFANLEKYLGVIMSNIGNLNDAILKIRNAIYLFEKFQYTDGVNVSYFDLGIAYYNSGLIDSSILYLSKSKIYWKGFNNIVRIFAINNYLIKCYFKNNNSTSKINIIYENNSLLSSGKIPNILLRDYSSILYNIIFSINTIVY